MQSVNCGKKNIKKKKQTNSTENMGEARIWFVYIVLICGAAINCQIATKLFEQSNRKEKKTQTQNIKHTQKYTRNKTKMISIMWELQSN